MRAYVRLLIAAGAFAICVAPTTSGAQEPSYSPTRHDNRICGVSQYRRGTTCIWAMFPPNPTGFSCGWRVENTRDFKCVRYDPNDPNAGAATEQRSERRSEPQTRHGQEIRPGVWLVCGQDVDGVLNPTGVGRVCVQTVYPPRADYVPYCGLKHVEGYFGTVYHCVRAEPFTSGAAAAAPSLGASPSVADNDSALRALQARRAAEEAAQRAGTDAANADVIRRDRAVVDRNARAQADYEARKRAHDRAVAEAEAKRLKYERDKAEAEARRRQYERDRAAWRAAACKAGDRTQC